jgi:hypothetical protein
LIKNKNVKKNKNQIINNAPDVPNEPVELWQSAHAPDVSDKPVKP